MKSYRTMHIIFINFIMDRHTVGTWKKFLMLVQLFLADFWQHAFRNIALPREPWELRGIYSVCFQFNGTELISKRVYSDKAVDLNTKTNLNINVYLDCAGVKNWTFNVSILFWLILIFTSEISSGSRFQWF